MAIEVLGVANLYAIDPLKRICADIVSRSICVNNVANILQAADAYQVASCPRHTGHLRGTRHREHEPAAI